VRDVETFLFLLRFSAASATTTSWSSYTELVPGSLQDYISQQSHN